MPHDVIHVKDIDQIDLDRHAVIEASAGTGKTYCIENLVVRLLCEKEIPLEKILLVTFTEKATGDLHARIRSNILQAMNDGVGRRSFLQQALENFDAAAIYTIHGFCQRMLRQYAFENGGNFNLEMAADDQLYPTLLRVQQRDEWPQVYGDRLEFMLQISGYPGTVDNDGVSSWETRVLDLAKRYTPHAGDRLLPEPGGFDTMSSLDGVISDALDEVLACLGNVDDALSGDEPGLIARFQSLPMHSSTSAACINRVLVPLIRFLKDHQNTPASLISLKQLLDHCSQYKRFSELGFACLVQGIYDNKLTDATTPAATFFEILATTLDEAVGASGVTSMKEWLAARTVRRLVEMASAHKLEHGLISFDDMLVMMSESLNVETNPRAEHMLNQMRRRFAYALVDEFQDTDPIQWDIFRRIFLGSPDHRLFLIGDPKQAIYSFRGADVYTYIQARGEMLDGHGAACYNLPVNWRSAPGLVNALNQLCGSDAWFTSRTENTEIPFQPVEVPPAEKRRHQLYVDCSHRAALSIVDLNQAERKPASARSWMAKFVVDEIERLLHANTLVYGSNDSRHRLDYGDICVLVTRRSEAAALEERFIAQGVPYTFYKQGGVYESKEAGHLYFLFKAIADPGDAPAVRAALLTSAFRLTPTDLAQQPSLPPQHPARLQLNAWHGLAAKRDWPELFRSILEDSRLVIDEVGKPEGERRICNYRHILQDLLVAAETGNLDVEDLIEIVRNYQENYTLLPDKADTQKQSSDEPKVQVMTIHSSKGLEFPVVFLLGGFTNAPAADYFEFHTDEGARVYDLMKMEDNRERWIAEQAAEDLRLFYVALTRAIFKLYVPRFRPDRMGYAGPVSHFLFSSIEDAFQSSDTPDVRHIDVKGHDLYSSQPIPDYLFEGAVADEPDKDPLVALPDHLSINLPEFSHRMRVIGSFSSLNTHGDSGSEATLLDLAHQFAEEQSISDETFTWMDEVEPVRPGSDLPPGATTGSMLHHVFETIDFSDVRQSRQAEDLIQPGSTSLTAIDGALAQFPLTTTIDVAEQRRLTAELIYNSLTCPLFDDGFVLAELPLEDRLHEMEFMFPALQGLDVPEMDYRAGYLVGFIDLIFTYQGKYYILDWKSNFLKNGYNQEQLEECMTDAGYHLQYKIYSLALCRWLATAIPDFSPETHFGGVFYLFLRGTETGNPESGIFRFHPDSSDIFVDWRHELAGYFRTR